MTVGKLILSLLISLAPQFVLANVQVDSTPKLASAISDGAEGDTIVIAPGVYMLDGPLEPKSGMTLKGAGPDKTIITHVSEWKPSTKTLPDPETKLQGMDTRAYLIRIADKASDVTISNLTLRGPHVHGAIYAFGHRNLHLHHLRIQDVLASGIRTHQMQNSKIHDCEFIDAGGRWKRGGIPGEDGGISGGAIFAVWTTDTEISNNRFTRTQLGKADGHYGVKGRQMRRCRIHHNTIEVNFSIELPFEGDEDVEIDHNICHGTISIPKYKGGPVPESGRTFHIHHNYCTSSYAIEFVRNGVEIDHNLFDFDTQQDGGNLISAFGKEPAPGPAVFHNNLVNNPGRGLIWMNEPYNHLTFRNNHVITRTTATPRTEGLFGFNRKCDFSTFSITNNIIECRGQSRPLMRNEESYGATIQNNRLTNITDTDQYANPPTDKPIGPEAPLKFQCGMNGELQVNGWEVNSAKHQSTGQAHQ